jgi:hypothetical protein
MQVRRRISAVIKAEKAYNGRKTMLKHPYLKNDLYFATR